MALWIVLDRDGVINHDSDSYIKSPHEWHPIEGSLGAIAKLTKAGYRIAVATNQSGLARGLFDETTLVAIHKKMLTMIAQNGGHIDGIFFCPHGPEDQCDCRKPKAGLLEQIEQRFSISLAGAPFVGDSRKDLQAAFAKACKPVLVLTGKGEKTQREIAGKREYAAVPVYEDLASYARALLA